MSIYDIPEFAPRQPERAPETVSPAVETPPRPVVRETARESLRPDLSQDDLATICDALSVYVAAISDNYVEGTWTRRQFDEKLAERRDLWNRLTNYLEGE